MKYALIAIASFSLMPIAGAAEVTISYSDDFATELEDNYGEREGDILRREIAKDLTQAFDKVGVDPARVQVTILDAKPNRPTLEQMRQKPGLDGFRSISLGGMELQATAYDEAGNELASHEYGWFENNLRDVMGHSVWSDARRASDRFSRKFADKLSG